MLVKLAHFMITFSGTKLFCAALMCLQFVCVIFLPKKISGKGAQKCTFHQRAALQYASFLNVDVAIVCVCNYFGKKISAKAANELFIKLTKVYSSATFYVQFLCTKLFCTAFKCLQFGFVIFCLKKISGKAAHKMKLTKVFSSPTFYKQLFLVNKCFAHQLQENQPQNRLTFKASLHQ